MNEKILKSVLIEPFMFLPNNEKCALTDLRLAQLDGNRKDQTRVILN